MATEEASEVRSTLLQGHQDAVLCLAYGGHRSCTNDVLLSGSEDKTCRVWDLRQSQRASVCVRCNEEVTSVAFGPPSSIDSQVDDGNTVLGYDLRQAKTPIISEPNVSLDFIGATDDISQISFAPPSKTVLPQRKKGRSGSVNKKRTTNPFVSNINLAVGDDSGMIRFTKDYSLTMQESCCRDQGAVDVVSHAAEGTDALTTCIAYAPKSTSKQSLIASGGTDCRICLWIEGRKNHVACVCIPSLDTGANQLCNPPMINCLAWSPSGQILTASLGDGSVAVMKATASSLVVISRLEESHDSAVASCLFPKWGPGNNAITSHDRLFVTAGNDGKILFWDLGELISGVKAESPSNILGSMLETNNGTPSTTTEEALDGLPSTLFALQHSANAKPNWMISTPSTSSIRFSSALFVADTTRDISVYSFPA